ncbi:DHA2 family efflux MFS transporter permease subunit [Zwartia panacis]|uniref:DHA2 family efflux MFS transporter permease subunit n=1 Tax=Zwartia panacis TaxID=2683345 RepID=UPI0025B53A0B|nr:DHA2 family efflux MFS transporter permease subunit [Zwartia panacis]MDN4016267.1 DHA2 family efflux MFS transporter permease subunit [Zwartia panacis]
MSSPTLDPPTPAQRILPFIVGCALLMQMLDSTVVTTALPAMARDLGSDPISMNITITSYLIAVAMFVPVSGWAADRYGARKVFIAAIALFTLSSLTCALSSSLTQLVISRVVQGLGGAMMVPVGRIILLRTIPKHNLLKAMAFLSMPALIGPMAGPPLGGLLVTYASWQWIFLINIPIGILGIWLIMRYVQALPTDTESPRLDVVGFLLSAVCMAALVSGFESLGHGGPQAWVSATLIATGLITGYLYVLHSRRHPNPILDLTLLRTPTFRAAVLAGNLCRFAVGATPYLLALLLQIGFGMSALSAGLITFVGAVGSLLMKMAAPRILNRWGYRYVLTVNAVLTGLSLAACASFTPEMPSVLMLGILLIGGFFRSLQFTAVNTLAYADISHAGMSRASSFAAMAQQLGVSLGVGVAAESLSLSMAWRGSNNLIAADVMVGFIVIGTLCALASLAFWKLSPHAGESLRQR